MRSGLSAVRRDWVPGRAGVSYCSIMNEGKRDLHAVGFCDGADVVRSGDGTCDRCLLLIVREALACKVGAASLRNLEDDWGFDVPMGWGVSGYTPSHKFRPYLAASRTAFAVEEDVTFWTISVGDRD